MVVDFTELMLKDTPPKSLNSFLSTVTLIFYFSFLQVHTKCLSVNNTHLYLKHEGLMHSGYPIMAMYTKVGHHLSMQTIKKQGLWGFIHEIGHNCQWESWTLPPLTDATNNLVSIFVTRKVGGNHFKEGSQAERQPLGIEGLLSALLIC